MTIMTVLPFVLLAVALIIVGAHTIQTAAGKAVLVLAVVALLLYFLALLGVRA